MEVKLLLAYNIKPNREAEYYRYVLGEFLPNLQDVGLMMVEGWHTAYGDYPIRLLVFRAQDEANMFDILNTSKWKDGKEKLLKLVSNYEERIVQAKNIFQFFIPSNKKEE